MASVAPSYMRDLEQSDGSNRSPRFVFKPVAIPQTTANWSSPFLRAYADILADDFDISMSRWLAFIDGLNEVHVRNAALKITGQAAAITGFIPSIIAQAVSAGTAITTHVGDRTRSKVQTTKYLKEANELLFAPRGLYVKILETDKALKLLGLPPSAKSTSADVLAHARARLVGEVDDTPDRFAPFGDAVQELHLIPSDQSPTVQPGMMGKLNRASVSLETWSNERKIDRAAGKLVKAEARGRPRKIERQLRRYGNATGEQAGDLPRARGLIGGEASLE